MDIGKLTTGHSTRKITNPKGDKPTVSMSKADLNQAVKAWNTADLNTKLTSLSTVYDKADQLNAIKDLLTAAGMTPSDSLMEMASAMLDGGLSLDVDSLKKFKQQAMLFNLLDKEQATLVEHVKVTTPDKPASLPKGATPVQGEPAVIPTTAAQTLDKTLLVLKNDLPINTPTSQAINQFARGELSLSKQLANLAERLATIDSSVIKETLIKQVVAPEVLAKINIPQPEPVTHTTIPTPQVVSPPQATATPELAPLSPSLTPLDIPLTTTEVPPSTTPLPVMPEQMIPAPLPTAGESHIQLVTPEQASPTAEQPLLSPAVTEPALQPDIAINAARIPISTDQFLTQLDPSELTQLLEQSYQLDLTQPKEQIDQTVNRLLTNLQTLTDTLTDSTLQAQLSPETRSGINNTLNHIQQQVSFSQGLNNAMYIPLPLVINNQQLDGQLFIFKDGKNSPQKKNTGATSALIGLDTANLGRVETYIQKIGEQIHLQFRMDEESTQQLFRRSLSALTDQLPVASVSYNTLDKPFVPLEVVSDAGVSAYDGFEVFA